MGRIGVAILVAIVFAATGCTIFGGRSFEDSIVFQPSCFPDGDWTPEPSFEDAWFDSSDGTRLHGWFAEAERPRAVILYTHGNAGNLSSRRFVLHLFRERLNASVLVFDYRGYGRSEGTPSEAGVLADARAARRWLAERTHVREQDIVLVGHSLGGAVAVDLAAADGARGLVLESTFTCLSDVAASRLPLVPFRHMMRNQLRSEAKLPNYHGPLLQTHGDADRIVPYQLGCKLFRAANDPKKFISVPGGGHNGPPTREYLAALDRFLDTLPVQN